ncbi:MAG: hypothetical protein OXH76_08375 [Boseongicola sp.]|nr:hypothetical protein [Boseongicola sp.]
MLIYWCNGTLRFKPHNKKEGEALITLYESLQSDTLKFGIDQMRKEAGIPPVEERESYKTKQAILRGDIFAADLPDDDLAIGTDQDLE